MKKKNVSPLQGIMAMCQGHNTNGNEKKGKKESCNIFNRSEPLPTGMFGARKGIPLEILHRGATLLAAVYVSVSGKY